MYEHTQIYKMYIKILRHGNRTQNKQWINFEDFTLKKGIPQVQHDMTAASPSMAFSCTRFTEKDKPKGTNTQIFQFLY
jgi:hypothetical protein